jgi:hypothetical protein
MNKEWDIVIRKYEYVLLWYGLYEYPSSVLTIPIGFYDTILLGSSTLKYIYIQTYLDVFIITL